MDVEGMKVMVAYLTLASAEMETQFFGLDVVLSAEISSDYLNKNGNLILVISLCS